MPALPLGDAGPYVAAAYLVFLGLILVYVGIMASKLVRIERQAAELNELVARRDRAAAGEAVAGRETGSLETRHDEPAHPADEPTRHDEPIQRDEPTHRGDPVERT